MLQWMMVFSGPVTALVFAGMQRLLRAGMEDAARGEISQELRGELARFRAELVDELDERYRRLPECGLISGGILSRLNTVDERFKEMEGYSHERIHSLYEDLHKLSIDVSKQLRTVKAEG
jgi:hypothetical protein